MKKSIKILVPFTVVASFLFFVTCGPGGPKVQLTEKGKLLTSIAWKLDPNATIKSATDQIKDTAGVISKIELKDDVKKIADFLSETVKFQIDSKDPSKLAYSRTIGEGFLSTSVTGFWTFNQDESAIIMKEWDKQAGKEKDPVTYKIVELSREKLILQKEGDTAPNIYMPKH